MILIDLDGTLVDSVPDLCYCVDTMMEQLGLPAHGEAKVRQWVGNGVERLTKRALVGQLEGEPEQALFEKAYLIFLELYAENTSGRSCLYPGVREGLDAMKAAGFRIACVTNKAEQFTIPLLKDMGIYDDFELVVSGDTLPTKKPDPGQLLHAAAFFNAEPQDALMIGDSVNDVKAARAAGFNVVCVPYGYNHGMDIREANPDAVIESFVELTGLFETAA